MAVICNTGMSKRQSAIPAQPTAFSGLPSLASPAAGFVSTGNEVVFKWSPIEGALEYIVCLHFTGYEDAPCGGGNVLIAAGDRAFAGSDTEYRWNIHHTLAASGERTEFIWSVVACYPQWEDPASRGYCEPGSQWRPLSVDLAGGLLAPELLNPENGETVTSRNVAFEFLRSDGAYGYVLCIFEYEHRNDHCDFNASPDNGMAVWVGDEFTDGSFEVEILSEYAPAGQVSELYWTIASCSVDAYTCPGQGERRSLLVDLTGNGLLAPNLVSPTDGYVTSDSPVYLTWDAVQGAASYRVCLAYDPGDYCHENPTFLSSYLDP